MLRLEEPVAKLEEPNSFTELEEPDSSVRFARFPPSGPVSMRPVMQE